MNHRDAIEYCRRERERALIDVSHSRDELGYATAPAAQHELRAALYDCTALLIEALGRVRSARPGKDTAEV